MTFCLFHLKILTADLQCMNWAFHHENHTKNVLELLERLESSFKVISLIEGRNKLCISWIIMVLFFSLSCCYCWNFGAFIVGSGEISSTWRHCSL